jgi:predicted RNase H-like nuclease (RuvC/YqgF family)
MLEMKPDGVSDDIFNDLVNALDKAIMLIYDMSIIIDEAAEAIEALQVENEQLKADCDRMLGKMQELTMKYNYFKERLQISPYGDDKIDELDEALENYKFQYEQLKQENKQLRARVAQYREALRKAREMLHKGISELKVHCKYFDQTPEEDICIEMHEAIIEIDKVIGGKEE